MKLGLKRDEVKLDIYTPEWSNEFDRVKNAIIKNTKIAEQQIEHIGSTSIIGMDAKPIIGTFLNQCGQMDLPTVQTTSKLRSRMNQTKTFLAI